MDSNVRPTLLNVRRAIGTCHMYSKLFFQIVKRTTFYRLRRLNHFAGGNSIIGEHWSHFKVLSLDSKVRTNYNSNEKYHQRTVPRGALSGAFLRAGGYILLGFRIPQSKRNASLYAIINSTENDLITFLHFSDSLVQLLIVLNTYALLICRLRYTVIFSKRSRWS